MRDEIKVTFKKNHVAVVEICKPPNNFFSTNLISGLADTFEQLDENNDVRVSLLCAANSSSLYRCNDGFTASKDAHCACIQTKRVVSIRIS